MNVIPIVGFSEPVSCLSHLAAAVFAFAGAFILCSRGRGNASRIFALILYSFSVVFLFSMSGVYHLLEPGGLPRAVLQRLDHAGIWVLIAGTFTPIHIILFRGIWRWGILAFVWTIAITGLVLEVVFFDSFPAVISLSLYLGLGWVGALTGYKFRNSFRDHSLRYLIGGGIFYSIGAVIDFINWPILLDGIIGPHEIFHFFVIMGWLSHWYFIYLWANHPIANKIVFHIHVFPNGQYLAKAKGEAIAIESNSLENLKMSIKEKVYRAYHQSIVPKVHLRYFQEEHLE